jgi:MYXO-CTERM domain-containing protein
MSYRPILFGLNLLAAFAMLSGCAAPIDAESVPGSTRSAIMGGTADPGDTNVVGIVWQSSGGGVQECSGSLLATNLVLTAHHCVSDVLNKPNGADCATSQFAAPDAPSNLSVSTKDLASTSPADFHTVREIVVPSASTNTTFCGFDVALLILSHAIQPSEAVPLVPRIDSEIAPNDVYSAVGLGSDGAGNSGTRRRLDGLLVDCVGPGCASIDAGQIDAGQIDTQHEWLGDHGPCQGDSGGPALDAANRVIGVTSRGAGDCTAPIYDDVYSWADWIKETAQHAAAVGNYTAPSWALGDSTPRDPVSGNSGCNVSASEPTAVAPWLLGAAAMAMALRRRRGSQWACWVAGCARISPHGTTGRSRRAHGPRARDPRWAISGGRLR